MIVYPDSRYFLELDEGLTKMSGKTIWFGHDDYNT